MSTIQFLGATSEVTGSQFLVTTAHGKRVLIDCGMHQGSRLEESENFAPFAYDPSTIDLAVLTHAHLDHAGRLPKLVKDGFRGPIVATGATADLAHLVMADAQKIMEEEADEHHQALYTLEDVNRTMAQFERVEYGIILTVAGLSVRLLDAGHILGSAVVELFDEGSVVVFSGDLGNAGSPILRDRQSPRSATTLIIESTYGGRSHEPLAAREELLRKHITSSIRKKGVVMIPSFAIERTQELLYEIDRLQKEGKIPRVPVFLDSPMAINATSVFERYTRLWNAASRERKVSGDDFFHFPGLVRTLTSEDSRKINDVRGPKIIIAGAGMLEGGRILHHLKRYLSDPRCALIIVGYQAKGTLGRELLDGVKRVKIHDMWVAVNATIKAIGAYSAHADGPQLLDWIGAITQKPEQIFLVHGELDQMKLLKKAIEKKFHIPVGIPARGDVVELKQLKQPLSQPIAA